MSRPRFDTLVALGMLAIFGTMTAIATGFGSKAGFMPLLIGIPAVALSLLQLGIELRKDREAARRRAAGGVMPAGPSPARELTMWGWFLALVGAILAFGFWIAVPAIIAGFLRTQAKRRWASALLAAAVGTGALYVMFGLILQVPLHEGFATAWIRKSL